MMQCSVTNYLIKQRLARVIAVQADVSDPSQVKVLFDVVEKAFEDQVHILIACMGIIDPTFPSIANMTMEGFEKALNVNTKGTFLCIQEDAHGYGAFLTSTAVVKEMTKIIAKELKGTKITTNYIGPGPIATESFLSLASKEMVEMCLNRLPLLRLGEPEDVVVTVGFLVSDNGEWVNGQVISVHGGPWS
ncbi:hypothetical protein Ancab_038793 [Ancistrocladus abbreviatus]